LPGAQAPRDAAGLAHLALEVVVVLGVVELGAKTPGGELGHLEGELLAQRADRVEVLAAPGPEFDRGETMLGRAADALEEGQRLPPHLDVDREARVGGAA